MSNYALTTDGRSPVELETRLARYLPGIDVRLWQYSPTQAIIASALVRALRLQYPDIQSGPLLKSLGVAEIRAVSDEETVHLIRGRDLDALPNRAIQTIPSSADGIDWHLVSAKVPEAWSMLNGPNNIAWGSISVGHIDTGYTNHPAFGFPAAPWVDVHQAKTFFPAAPIGEDSMFPKQGLPGVDNLIGPSDGHGTRTLSTICGFAPNESSGAFYGVAPKVPVVPVRISDTVWINHAQREFGKAITYLVQTARVRVINVSLGVVAGVAVTEMREAINIAYDAGVILVCAAGNYVNSVVAPAALKRTLAIAGVDSNLSWWSGSSYGSEVDLSAPAVDLRRATINKRGRFVYAKGGDGTSYATAMTSGAAALWLARHAANLDAKYPMPWQRVEAFKLLVIQTTTKPSNWKAGAFGSGVLNLESLLQAPLPDAAMLVTTPRV